MRKEERICVECGKHFIGSTKAVYCSPDCRTNSLKIIGDDQEKIDLIQAYLKKDYGKKFNEKQKRMIKAGWNMNDYGKFQQQETLRLIKEKKL